MTCAICHHELCWNKTEGVWMLTEIAYERVLRGRGGSWCYSKDHRPGFSADACRDLVAVVFA